MNNCSICELGYSDVYPLGAHSGNCTLRQPKFSVEDQKLVAEHFTGMSLHTFLLNGGIEAHAKALSTTGELLVNRAKAAVARDDACQSFMLCDRRSKRRRADLEAAYKKAQADYEQACAEIHN